MMTTVVAAELLPALKERVRRLGIDPQLARAEVHDVARDLVDGAVEAARSRMATAVADASGVRADGLTSLGPDGVDDLVRVLVDHLSGFGPLQPYLDDPEVEEIWINSPTKVFVARRGRSELTTTVLDAAQVRELVERMLRLSGRRVDVTTPFVDAMLPDGSRIHVVIPDVVHRHWSVNIRKHVVRATGMADLVALGTMDAATAMLLDAAVRAGLNIIVAGGTQAGKTTTLGALIAATPPSERVITMEEVFELRVRLPDTVAMQTRQAGLEGTGGVTLRDLVVQSLRMRPNRIVVGEVRQAEALDLLLALNSGMPAMGTLHANSAREAVTKLCTLPLLAGENIGAAFVVPTVASAIDLIVHVETLPSGRRVVGEVAAVPGSMEAGVVALEPLVKWEFDHWEHHSANLPRPQRLRRAGIDPAALVRQVERTVARGSRAGAGVAA